MNKSGQQVTYLLEIDELCDLPYLRYYGLKEEPFSTVPSPR